MLQSAYSHVTTRTESGVLILTITEKQLTGEVLCDAIREELLDAVQQKAGKVIVDFHNVDYVSSVAFRALLSLRRRVHDTEGRLVLCNLSPLVAEVFKVTRLLINSKSSPSMFDERPTIADAIAALNGPV
jgi:anti-sigma B factor antagonist